MMKTLEAQIQNNPYQATRGHFLIVLYHMEHFLCRLDRIAWLLLWIAQYEAPDKGQKCANQTLRK